MDPLLAARIRGQSGLVTRDQALAVGLTEKAVRWRLASGRWVRVHPQVYLTEPGRSGWEVRAVAALLHVGPPVALVGSSAGHAWSLLHRPDDPIQVLVPITRSGRVRDGIEVVRTRHLTGRVDPLAWPHRTTAAHTTLDLAHDRTLDGAVALMARARQLRIVTPVELQVALLGRTGQHHRRLLLEAVSELAAGAESIAELRYVRDVERAHGLPLGRRQAPAPGQRHRDSEYAGLRVVVEVDGRLGHEGWSGQVADRRRDLDAARDGWLTVRPTWVDVAGGPCALAVDLDTVFRTRGWTGHAHRCRRGGCPLPRMAR